MMSELKAILEDLNLKTINLKGKEYSMVSSRLEIFRKHFGFKYGIVEEILVDDGKRVVTKTSIIDRDKPETPIGVGHAEEIRGSSLVNKTSAIENCMTSSLGRALATAAALHGGEMASSNELEKANNNNKNIEEKEIKEKEENKDKDDDEEKWQKITQNYLRNIDEMKSQSMCMHWFNNNKDVLKNMKAIVPRMYGEIEEHYQKKLNSLQQ
tara:strand:- start:55 stop:687 length:633 start_codon:yes stop_codon:yes gene_type:complete